jgi:hypothetical protein
MSPIDDELRSALSSRTGTVGLSPDFLSGVERRAGRMRRRRVAATVAGSALAVSALGLGGPLVASTLTRDSGPPTVAAPQQTVDPAARYDLQAGHLWPFRGDAAARDDMAGATAVQWAATQGARPDDVELVPLWAEVFEPSGVATLVFLAREGTGPWHWAVASSGESGPEVLRDEVLQPRTYGLAVALPGDEVSRLLVLSSELTTPGYLHGDGDGVDGADGLLLAPREGDPDRDAFRVVAPDGTVLVEQRAPQPPAGASSPEGPGTEQVPGDVAAPPSNAVLWPTAGSASPELVEQALTSFATDVQTTRELVGGHLLYGLEEDGRSVVVLSAWEAGGDARTYGFTVDARGRTASTLTGPTSPGPAALAVLLPVADGLDWLVVVPKPGSGQVLYAPDASGEPRAVPSQGTGAAVYRERPSSTTGDRVVVLDGDGDLDRPLYRGTVDELLAATAGGTR